VILVAIEKQKIGQKAEQQVAVQRENGIARDVQNYLLFQTYYQKRRTKKRAAQKSTDNFLVTVGYNHHKHPN
jgi:hypothetical protein